MSLDTWPLEISVSPATQLEIDLDGFDQVAVDDLTRALSNFSAKTGRAVRLQVSAKSWVRPHSGLGSKTGLLLGVLTLIDRVIGTALTRTEIQQLSGRGGASAIGLNTFFEGGVVVDCGHARHGTNGFLPSSAATPTKLPTKALRFDFPDDWLVAVMIPRGERTWGGREIEFFRKHTPIPDSEVMTVLAGVYHGVIPAFLELDLPSLKVGLKRIASCGFKRREIDAAGLTVSRLIDELDSKTDAAVGMSSLGPAVFAVYRRSDKDTGLAISKLGASQDLELFAVANGRNLGHEVQDGEPNGN